MVVAFYFRLHLAYFPRPVVAIFARPEHREFVSEYEYTFRWTMIIGSVFCAHRSVNISTECNEFSRFYKMESVTL